MSDPSLQKIAESARALLRTGALLGFMAVACGAFGVHALTARLAPDLLEIWKTGAQYQLIHSVAICLCGGLAAWSNSKKIATAGWLFVAGVAIFSGSLYVLAITGIRILGAVTPLGGLSMLAGWIVLALGSDDLLKASNRSG